MFVNGNGSGRHELKFLLSYGEYLSVKSRIAAVLEKDRHAGANGYFIRSIYFDDLKDSAYYDKQNGIAERRKYRIRSYDNDPGRIALECKEKHNKCIVKYAALIDRTTCDALLTGSFSLLENRTERVCLDLYRAYHEKGMRCSVTVDYQREAFVFPVSNLRITFDKNLHAGGFSEFSMFSKDPDKDITLPVYRNNSVILEIKYDQVIPETIRSLMPGFMGTQQSVSKYCLCKQIVKAIQ